jgi:hypothetical protein
MSLPPICCQSAPRTEYVQSFAVDEPPRLPVDINSCRFAGWSNGDQSFGRR